MTPATRYDVDQPGLAALLADEPAYRSRQVWKNLYDGLRHPEEMTDLPAGLRRTLDERLPPALRLVTEQVADGGETVKSLWELDGGARIETVLMSYRDRVTVCVSTQAGCAMACSFCATGQVGFERHLGVGEIVEQVMNAARAARPRRLSNVVFMGMGEPLANYDATVGAVRRLNTDLGIGARSLLVSTVGVVPNILRLADEGLQIGLAVSLHAADDTKRDELVPINRKYPLHQLAEACRHWSATTGRRVSFEWVMIDGVNDTPADAAALAELALPLRAHVNLIPLNRTPGYPTQGSPPERVSAFLADLAGRGVNATLRRTRGDEIDAACGQLRAGHQVTLAQPSRNRRRRTAKP
jgi:23S rRNA (adenine2503-C2)-methyltransferase